MAKYLGVVMKNCRSSQFLKAIVSVFLLFGFTCIYAQFAGGSGTVEDPYQVETVAHLGNVRNYLASCFRQISDIDLNVPPYNQNTGWWMIGDPSTGFSGKYNGAGYAISNLYINNPWSWNGLFASTVNAGLDSIRLENVNVTGNSYTGGLVGDAVGTTIRYCAVSGTVHGEVYTGGLVGHAADNTSLALCYSTAAVTGDTAVGGLVGYTFNNTTLTRCYSSGTVNGQQLTGGLAGQMSNGLVTDCFSSANVTAVFEMGGLIGSVANSAISSCYSVGQVFCLGFDSGGLIGDNYVSTVVNSYWNMQTSGQPTSAGGEGRNTADMTYPYAASTYINWDFAEIWQADENYAVNFGYPYLRSGAIINVLPMPSMNPLPGTYLDALQVTLACMVPDAEIRYTTDGTEPTEESFLYTAPVVVAGSLIMKAKAYKVGYIQSRTSTGVYDLVAGNPSFTPNGGYFTHPVVVWIYCATPEAGIYYTVNGTAPTEESILYTEPFQLFSSVQVRARAYRYGFQPSNISTAVYNITLDNSEEVGQADVLSCSAVPNPFRDNTSIRFDLPKSSRIAISIYNAKGQLVRTLTDGQYAKGEHTLTWDGKTDTGQHVSNGIYFYQLKGADFSISKKLMLMKQ
jgi:hypothetical protein